MTAIGRVPVSVGPRSGVVPGTTAPQVIEVLAGGSWVAQIQSSAERLETAKHLRFGTVVLLAWTPTLRPSRRNGGQGQFRRPPWGSCRLAPVPFDRCPTDAVHSSQHDLSRG